MSEVLEIRLTPEQLARREQFERDAVEHRAAGRVHVAGWVPKVARTEILNCMLRLREGEIDAAALADIGRSGAPQGAEAASEAAARIASLEAEVQRLGQDLAQAQTEAAEATAEGRREREARIAAEAQAAQAAAEQAGLVAGLQAEVERFEQGLVQARAELVEAAAETRMEREARIAADARAAQAETENGELRHNLAAVQGRVVQIEAVLDRPGFSNRIGRWLIGARSTEG